MNQIRLLSYLLASIFMVGMTSVNVLGQTNSGENTVSQPPTKSPTPTSSPNPSPKSKSPNPSPKSPTPSPTPSPIPSPSPPPVNNGSMNWLFIGSGVFHLATLGGLIYLFLELRKISDRAKISDRLLSKKIDKPDRDPFSTKTDLNKIDKEINNRIRELAEKQEILDVSISNIRREIKDSLATLAVTSRDSSSKNQNFATDLNNLQPHNLLSAYYPSENTEPAYLTDYNNRQKNFTDTYRSLVVDRDPDNYNLSRAGQTEEIILTEESRGNYWLFSYDGLTYVVPSQKLKIREDKLNEVKDLFDCENYQESNYDNYTLIKPALVSKKVNGNWRLKEKGKLQFG